MEKFLILATLFAFTVNANEKTYYISPSSEQYLCQNYLLKSCFTLDDLPRYLNLSQGTNLTLSFLPGEHSLHHRIAITEISAVTSEAYQRNKPNEGIVLNCNGLYSTGINFQSMHKVIVRGLVFQGCRNTGVNGGAISIIHVKSVDIKDCSFRNNHVQEASGGAVYLALIQNIQIYNTAFTDNSVHCSGTCELKGGGAVHITMNSTVVTELHVSTSIFKRNKATGNGGAISLAWNCSDYQECRSNQSLDFNDSVFTNNVIIRTGDQKGSGRGGAISGTGTWSGRLSVSRSRFANNSAHTLGGAIYLEFNGEAFISQNNTYFNNHAEYGGALYIETNSMSTKNNIFQENSASNGGAVSMQGIFGTQTWIAESDTFIRNSCENNGGAVNFLMVEVIKIIKGCFLDNIAKQGAGIYSAGALPMEINNSIFIGNHHTSDDSGTVHTIQSTLTFKTGVVFTNNEGALYTVDSQVTFQGETLMENNTANQGGGITCAQSTLTFETESTTKLIGNRASYGGGMSLYQCNVYTKGKVVIDTNLAAYSGGGIFAFQSAIQLSKHSDSTANFIFWRNEVYITSNAAHQNGGGMAIIASNIIVSNTYTFFVNNSAGNNGGGLHLENAYLKLTREFSETDVNSLLKLEFTNNTARRKGGAIYISDKTNTKELCERATPENAILRRCFMQVQHTDDYGDYRDAEITYFTIFWFQGNTAENRGEDIYGGLLDRCTIDPKTILLQRYPQYRNAYGLQYLQAIALFANTNSGHISSDAMTICFCEGHRVHCNHTHSTIEVRKGETFSISIVAVDQTQTPLTATVMSSLLIRDGIGRLKEGQQSQVVSNHCTELTFNAYSSNDSATLQLYAEGPCGNLGISLQEVNITFLPCVSPVGFQRTALPNDCTFECDHRLQSYISNCSVKDETVQVEKNVWIQYVNTSSSTGYVIQDCPYDYCVNKPVNITLSTREGTDKQCAFNRTGKLCGQRAEGLSLVFASSRCWECTNHWLLLLIPFALAGVLLVAIVLLLHKAVDNGALHGLLFYANILAANYSIFYPFPEQALFTIFISWLNLDLGIETCFYNGMTSTAKVLLQLAFPLYIFALMGAIIILVKVSDSKTSKVSGLLSKGKPVEGLCMLILLSYSKLLRTVIASLQFTTLNYPDGTREIVWLLDANIQYLGKEHLAPFILSIAIIIIGGVYTGLLLFGQCLTKRLTNPRYKTILEAHYRPLTERHRYWIGLLLLARTIHYLVSALSADTVTLFSAGSIAIGLIIFKQFHALNNRQLRVKDEVQYFATYKNVVVEILEVSFLLNLGVLALGTSTIGSESQFTLVHISIALAFLTSLAILISGIALNIRSKVFYYQKWKQLLSNLKTRVKPFKQICTRSQNVSRFHQLEDFAHLPIQEEPDYPDLQDPQPYTDPTQANTTSLRDDPPQPRRYDPPVITLCSPAITSTELREELLADTEEGDVQVQYYRQRTRSSCTYQEILI